MRLLLFAGTTEGRVLAEALAALAVDVTISVATDYGREMLAGLPARFTVLCGRMDVEAMRATMRRGRFDYVIDATHPYAVVAGESIHQAARDEKVRHIRLLRDEGGGGGCLYVPSVAAAAERLAETTGNILLATGSKELAAYTTLADYARRCHPRVLPSRDAIGECERLGFARSRIIAMQGPFGRELNAAIMRHYGIRVLVTKDGGKEGGFPEKIQAAEETGVTTLVVGRPPERPGCCLADLLDRLRRELETRA